MLPTASSLTENHCPRVCGDRVSIAVLQILQLASREPGKIPPFQNILERFCPVGWFFFSGHRWGLLLSPDLKWSSC